MSKLLPLRMDLLRRLAKGGKNGVAGGKLLAELQECYRGERQCAREVVFDHLFNMASLGLILAANERLDEDGNLDLDFSLTAEGLSRGKYFPPAWSF